MTTRAGRSDVRSPTRGPANAAPQEERLGVQP